MDNLHYYAITDLNIEYLGVDVGLEVLQKAVGCWIEALPAQQMWEVAYVDEEGRLKSLPVNHLASGLIGYEVCGIMVIGTKSKSLQQVITNKE